MNVYHPIVYKYVYKYIIFSDEEIYLSYKLIIKNYKKKKIIYTNLIVFRIIYIIL